MPLWNSLRARLAPHSNVPGRNLPSRVAVASRRAGLPVTHVLAGGFGEGLTLAQNQSGLQGDLAGLIATFVQGALVLVGVLALAFLVYGGFLYITSRGDPDQIKKAKRVLTYAVVGIVVVGLAFAVVEFVIKTFRPLAV